jgi:hypothetical protein
MHGMHSFIVKSCPDTPLYTFIHLLDPEEESSEHTSRSSWDSASNYDIPFSPQVSDVENDRFTVSDYYRDSFVTRYRKGRNRETDR